MNLDPVALSAQVEELLQFVYLMPVAIVKMDANGKVELINPEAVQLLEDLDLNPGSQDGLYILEALLAGLGEAWKQSESTIGEICAPIRIQRSVQKRDRHLILRLVRPDKRCTMLAIEDVTDTVEKEREISRQKQRFGVVMEQLEGYCVVMVDLAGNMQEWNLSIDRMFGTETKTLEGRALDKVLNSVTANNLPALKFQHVKNMIDHQGAYRSEAVFLTPSNAIIWGDIAATPTVEESGATTGYVCVIRDVTEQHKTNERLITDAHTDPLTGLLNRRGLEYQVASWLGSEAGRSSSSSWIMADIDHFKTVNDTYGHQVGDEVLQRFAKILRASTRETDIIARLGGEEFLILVAGAQTTAALHSAEHIRATVEKARMTADGQEFSITSSFGVLAHTAHSDWHAEVTAVDAALYEAKSAGRNRVVLGT